MKYDSIINRKLKDNIDIEYGIIKGNNTVVLIKVGQDGSIYGYDNKYLKIATNLNNKYGYTVISSSNPYDGTNPLDNAIEVIDEYCQSKDYTIYYMGHSNGARIGMYYGNLYPQIKKMLLINAPIFINFDKIKKELSNINDKEIILVYGKEDQSYKFKTLIDSLLKDNIKLEIINTDHYFTNNIDNFIQLPEDHFKTKQLN